MITDPHTTSEIIINKRKIPVWIYGNKSNPLIIFLHGHFRGFSEYVGDLPMRYLMKDYCVATFDLPGYGSSKDLKFDRIDFINEVIKNIFKNRTFVIFGTSYGGLLSIKYALKYPGSVKGLIVAGTPLYFGIRKIFIWSSKIPLLNRFEIPKLLTEFSYLNNDNLKKLNVPTLLFYSNNDILATVSMGEKLQKLIPNSRILFVNNRRHNWLLHRVDESGLLNEIEKLLKTIDF